MFNAYVVCTRGHGRFMKEGKIYQFKDGRVTYDNMDVSGRVSNVTHFNNFHHTQVKEIKTNGKEV